MQGFKLNHVSKRATADNLSQPGNRTSVPTVLNSFSGSGYWNSIKFFMEILLLQKYL